MDRVEKLSLLIASDVRLDTLSVELIGEDGDVIAQVARYDSSKQLTLTTFSNEIDLTAIEAMIAIARRWLEPFEDGTPLSAAIHVQRLEQG